MLRVAGLPMNVIVLSHIDEDKDEYQGKFVRNPALPGRLRKRIASGYGEHYRSYVADLEDGTKAYLLQTQANEFYAAQSQIDAPNPCYPHWESLWANWGK